MCRTRPYGQHGLSKDLGWDMEESATYVDSGFLLAPVWRKDIRNRSWMSFALWRDKTPAMLLDKSGVLEVPVRFCVCGSYSHVSQSCTCYSASRGNLVAYVAAACAVNVSYLGPPNTLVA